MFSWLEKLYYEGLWNSCEHEWKYLRCEMEEDLINLKLRTIDFYVCKSCQKTKKEETIQDYKD